MNYFLPRSDFYIHLGFYVICFTSYLLLYRSFSKHQYPVWWGIGFANFLRLLLLGAMPVFSDDFIWFVWDGHQVWKGINFYLHIPEEMPVISDYFQHPYFSSLLEQMNSPAYYSVFTPLNQVFFLWQRVLAGRIYS